MGTLQKTSFEVSFRLLNNSLHKQKGIFVLNSSFQVTCWGDVRFLLLIHKAHISPIIGLLFIADVMRQLVIGIQEKDVLIEWPEKWRIISISIRCRNNYSNEALKAFLCRVKNGLEN